MSSIVIDSENEWYDSREGCNAVIRKRDSWLIAGCSTTKIPESVTKIAPQAFEECPNLTSITIPANVKAILYEAFYNCTRLEEIIIPDGVRAVGKHAFGGCSNLRSVALPSSIQELDELIFYNCQSLYSVTSYMESPLRLPQMTFYGIASNATLHIPAGTRDAYIAAGWSEPFAKIEEFAPTSITAPSEGFINHQSIHPQWFSLSGRQLSTPPTHKGIYIKDGKKVMVK